MSAGPTQGPWVVGSSESHGTAVYGPMGVTVAWCGTATAATADGSYSIRRGEAASNARLIAAALTLRGVLQRLISASDACSLDYATAEEVLVYDRAYVAACDAVAATGEQP